MAIITVTEKATDKENLYYIQSAFGEIKDQLGCHVELSDFATRSVLKIEMPDAYAEAVRCEIADKCAEVVAINYKYEYFIKNIKIVGLTETEREILMASLIAADLEEDKRYAYIRLKYGDEIAIDGIFNFRLKELKKKWEDIVSFMPDCFINGQLKDFITYLLENKKKRVYVDGEAVYDSTFKRLKRCDLIGGEEVKVLREILLSNCGEIELMSPVPEKDEKYLKEYYKDKILFSDKYFNQNV